MLAAIFDSFWSNLSRSSDFATPKSQFITEPTPARGLRLTLLGAPSTAPLRISNLFLARPSRCSSVRVPDTNLIWTEGRLTPVSAGS